jgi:hypothetical protein
VHPTHESEVVMKDVSMALLAVLFVVISLVTLISADSAPGPSWMRGSAQEHVSELGLRYALHR